MMFEGNKFIDYLSNVVYSEDGISRAGEYLNKRGIDANKLRYPWTVTSNESNQFKIFDSDYFGKRYPPYIFTDSLYIPITDLMKPDRLVGFDVRYLGTDEKRLRFHKFKRSDEEIMFYYNKPIYEIKSEEPVIITEGAIDAESIIQFGYNVISPLTAYSNLRFIIFLYTITDRVYFMYDNDSTGKRAIEKVMDTVNINNRIRETFHTISYTGKDPNQALCSIGKDYLGYMLKVGVS